MDIIEKINLNAWDLFVTYLSGITFIILVFIHLLVKEIITLQDLTTIINLSFGIQIVIGIPLIFIIGLIFDACSIVLISPFFDHNLKVQKENEHDKKVNEIIKRKYMPKNLHDLVEPYFWANYTLSQKEVSTPYMVFLSKFGFYRNLCSLSCLNAIAVLVLYRISLITLVVVVSSLIISYAFMKRSNKFYQHCSKAVYGHYFVNKVK